MSAAKITLSDKELSLVMDRDWILTKRKIMEQVYDLFGNEIPVISRELIGLPAIPGEARSSNPKISRGENYHQMPWVMLDYPRHFSGTDAFAVRTLFLWGHFFSVTWHLSGRFAAEFAPVLSRILPVVQEDWFVCVSDDPWQHHFDTDYYMPALELTQPVLEDMWAERRFIKLAMKFPLDKWNDMPSVLDKAYARLAFLIAQLPSR